MTRDVVIVGGGYAGLFAARRLGRRRDVRVRLLDPREHQQSLPLLPDLIGRNLTSERLRYPLAAAARRWGFEHVRDEIVALDTARTTVVGRHAEYKADAVLLACGCGVVSCPFEAADRVHTLSSIETTAALRRTFVEGPRRNWVVAGGGYTGVETATHLWRCARQAGVDRKLFVVERGEALCGDMGAPFSEYVERNITWLGIEVMAKTRVVDIRDGDVLLDGDRRVKDAALVWSVGMEGRRFARDLDLPQTPGGRLNVTEFLRLERNENVFAAGDAAAFADSEGRPLRQSVQAAITMGSHAADNILRLLDGLPLRPYRHFDPGYVVPMANGRGCGIVLGRSVYGRLPALLHAVMGVYRSFGRNRSPLLLWQLLRR